MIIGPLRSEIQPVLLQCTICVPDWICCLWADKTPYVRAYLHAETWVTCSYRHKCLQSPPQQQKSVSFPTLLKHEDALSKLNWIVLFYQSIKSCSVSSLCNNCNLRLSQMNLLLPLKKKIKKNSPSAKSKRKESFLCLLEPYIMSYCCFNVFLNNENKDGAGSYDFFSLTNSSKKTNLWKFQCFFSIMIILSSTGMTLQFIVLCTFTRSQI